jgi:hypothetical protein
MVVARFTRAGRLGRDPLVEDEDVDALEATRETADGALVARLEPSLSVR